jgi:cellulose synthase/poly-beta-1,6-N-acetylglucosamine synthase-like glycosyltransferase
MSETILRISLLLIAYTLIGYPIVAILRAWLCKHEVKSADITPPMSIVIVAHNEAAVIRQKMENLLALDYPRDRLEIIVASDGSDDGTDSIVTEFEDRGIRLLSFPRRGKISALNAAVAQATGEILVFSDANSMYAVNALRALARPFADPAVGGVAGKQCYLEGRTNSSAGGERAYWNFDQALKQLQSRAWSVTSATGAIYAIRRVLFHMAPSGVADDAAVSYGVIASGYRMVFEPEAKAFEPVSSSADAEFRRKVRVCTRGLTALSVAPQLFNPFHYGFYSIQIISHKLLRWLLTWPLLALFLSSLWRFSAGPIHRTFAIAQVVFYGIAVAGYLSRNKAIYHGRAARLFALPFYFCLANVAFTLALFWRIRGRRIDSWEIRRAEAD